jgi:hypothetical protein
MIMISPSARGYGVAEELVLRCAEDREGLSFTSNFEGYSLLKRTRLLAVARTQNGSVFRNGYPSLPANRSDFDNPKLLLAIV